MSDFRLSRKERSRILAGDHTALKRPRRPDLKQGDTIVLSRSKAKRVVIDRDDRHRDRPKTAEVPEHIRVWIEVTEVNESLNRGAHARFQVIFKVHDHREGARFLGPISGPNPHAQMTEDSSKGYTTSPASAVDDLELVDPESQRKITTEGHMRFAEGLGGPAERERVIAQERSIREALKKAVRDDPVGGEFLLAGVQRLLDQHEEGQKEAA